MLNDTSKVATSPGRTILMTADSVGGVLTYALTLASELAKAGTKVHLAMLGPKQDPAQEAAIRAVPGLVLHESTFALEWMDESGADIPRASEWLRGIERDVRPDIIHLNGYCHGAAGFKAPVVIVAHYCALSWWESVEGGTLPERYSTYREAARRGLQAADAVIAVSQSMRANLERHYGALPRVAVIPNGRAVENPSSHEKEPFVLAAGRLSDKAKNIDALARVAKDLPWPVKIAGRRQDEPQKYVDSGVESLGWLPPAELGRLMARAAVFALPARYEPFGVSALEAALHGCALVLGDIPSLRELWGDAALYVRPDDDDGLKKAIAKLAGDASLRADMAAAAKLHGQLFTPARNARAMRDLYETMILARQLPAVTGAPGRETRSA